MEVTNRYERMDILWKMWKRNYALEGSESMESLFKNIGGLQEICVQSIKGKSLELIMEQLFAEINFLKEEVEFLREEGVQKSNLISTLTDSSLCKINNQRNHVLSVDVLNQNFNSIEYNDPSRLTTRVRKKLDAMNNSKEHTSTLLDFNDDSFLKDEILFLREETKQKSKLIANLTDALSTHTKKRQLQLHKLATQTRTLLRKKRSLTPKDEKNTTPLLTEYKRYTPKLKENEEVYIEQNDEKIFQRPSPALDEESESSDVLESEEVVSYPIADIAKHLYSLWKKDPTRLENANGSWLANTSSDISKDETNEKDNINNKQDEVSKEQYNRTCNKEMINANEKQVEKDTQNETPSKHQPWDNKLSEETTQDTICQLADQDGMKYLTRLRIGISHLRAHMFNTQYQDVPNPCCTCDNVSIETTAHYLLHCTNYTKLRSKLFETLRTVISFENPYKEKDIVNLLLYGDPSHTFEVNKRILETTIRYITDTSRFVQPLMSNDVYDGDTSQLS